MEQVIADAIAYAGSMFVFGFGGSILVVSVVGAIVSGFKALSKLGGGK